MERIHSHRDVGGSAPASSDVSPTVDGHGSDKGRHTSPWPVADTPGRPFIHPHRLAQATRDQGMVEALGSSEIERRIRGDRLADRIRSWVIVSSVVFMVVVLLWTAVDAYLDRAL